MSKRKYYIKPQISIRTTNKGDYYFKPQKRRTRGRTLRAIVRTMDIVMWVGSIIATLLLIMAMLARYINPAGIGWVFAFAALIFPILFVCEIVAALYWIVRWKWMAIVIGGFVLLCLPDARLFYKPDLGKHYETEISAKQGLVVMNYNVMSFRKYGGEGRANLRVAASEIAEYVNEQNVDILCTQEFLVKETVTEIHFDNVLRDLKYHYNASYSTPNGVDGLGVSIYSRYPIIGKGVIDVERGYRRSIWCDIKVHKDTIRVFCNHLQNTKVTVSDEEYLEEGVVGDGEVESEKVKGIVSRLIDSYRLRAPQADSLARAISSSPYPVIVCGDFNDTPLSYAYHRISEGLKDSYMAEGTTRSVMGTYHGFFNMFRIDYILYSKEFTATRFEVSDVELSDHSPIIAEIKIGK